MPDREKVIDAEKTIDILTYCIDDKHGCYGCPNRYTDGRVACKEFEQGYNTIPKSVVRDALALLKEQPEIVRCKDCKHRDPEDHKCDCGHDIQWQLPREDDWFCADGKRRDDDD